MRKNATGCWWTIFQEPSLLHLASKDISFNENDIMDTPGHHWDYHYLPFHTRRNRGIGKRTGALVEDSGGTSKVFNLTSAVKVFQEQWVRHIPDLLCNATMQVGVSLGQPASHPWYQLASRPESRLVNITSPRPRNPGSTMPSVCSCDSLSIPSRQ